jgi:hypothetical protein
MSPGPVQRPRPPLTVAANSPRMLRHAVAHADTWNTLSFALVDIARRAVGLGMSELVLYYPADPGQLPAFEAVAREVLPELRGEYAGWLPTGRPVR